jgi:hypothetical protein
MQNQVGVHAAGHFTVSGDPGSGMLISMLTLHERGG